MRQRIPFSVGVNALLMGRKETQMRISLTESQTEGIWAVVEVLKYLGLHWTFNSITNEQELERDDSFRRHRVRELPGRDSWGQNISIFMRRHPNHLWCAITAVFREGDSERKRLRFKYAQNRRFLGFETIDSSQEGPDYLWDLDKCFEAPAAVEKGGVNLEEFQGEVEKLLVLLKDRQPGHASWHMFLHERMTALRDLYFGR